MYLVRWTKLGFGLVASSSLLRIIRLYSALAFEPNIWCCSKMRSYSTAECILLLSVFYC
jgi:hypothetical protein